MTSAESAARPLTPAWAISLADKAWLPAFIFTATLVGYVLSRPHPIDWYDHHVFLAKAMLGGTFDISSTGIPDWFQDTVTVGHAKYLPYGPTPAILLMPFVAIWGVDFSEIYFSMVLGAVNVVLFWYLLKLFDVSPVTKFLMVPFFAFGTVHFYAATEGTLWFYNHVVAVFFLLIALILFQKKAPLFLVAVAIGLAWQSRGPALLAAAFFAYCIIKRQHPGFKLTSPREWLPIFKRRTVRDLAVFGAGLVPFAIFVLWYNWVRFDNPLDSGFQTVYNTYTGSGIAYSFYRVQFPGAEHFHLFDPRNIPLHLYTLFAMPPEYQPNWSIFRPSPYGLSILFTSPAFVYALAVKRLDIIKTACWIAIGLMAIPVFLHYSQGWVQYGYRFLLDFAPFLLVLTAFGFDDNRSPTSRRIQLALVALSIIAGFWGRHWGNVNGW